MHLVLSIGVSTTLYIISLFLSTRTHMHAYMHMKHKWETPITVILIQRHIQYNTGNSGSCCHHSVIGTHLHVGLTTFALNATHWLWDPCVTHGSINHQPCICVFRETWSIFFRRFIYYCHIVNIFQPVIYCWVSFIEHFLAVKLSSCYGLTWIFL